MKHVHLISRNTPAKADVWQDVVCMLAVSINLLLSLMGGSSPIFQFIEEKCAIPVPNNDS